jgi:hypothetical protein
VVRHGPRRGHRAGGDEAHPHRASAVDLHPDASFLVLPVLSGAALLVVFAALFNNLIEHRRYPLSWR